jgi:hypothetical protein
VSFKPAEPSLQQFFFRLGSHGFLSVGLGVLLVSRIKSTALMARELLLLVDCMMVHNTGESFATDAQLNASE